MRILYVINSFTLAGAEKLVFDLSREIRKSAEWVGVAALYRAGDETERAMLEALRLAGVDACILDKTAKRQRVRTVARLAGILRRERVDVLHAHCSVPMLLGKLAGRLCGVPVVCTIHSTKRYSRRRETLTRGLVAYYVSIGEAAERYMTDELRIPPRRIRRIYNAVDVRRFAPGGRDEGLRREYGLSEAYPLLLCVGRVAPEKNQLCVLRAVRRCRDGGRPVQLLVLGKYEPDSATYRSLRAFVSKNGLEELVRFAGMREDVPRFLRSADCFVLSSRYEGLSVSFLEAVLCGTPVVSAELPFVRELNAVGPCALAFPQEDDAALAELLSQRRYAPPSEAVRQRFSTLFSLERSAAEHLSLYREALSR